MAALFDPEELHQLVRGAIGPPIAEVHDRLLAALSARFPDRIARDTRWLFQNAGGAMGQMRVLYASLGEYLLFFGTPIGSEGHTGRFPAAELHSFVLAGEQWVYETGSTERQVYRPGDHIVLRRGEAQGYRYPRECWTLEYARGAIPLMLPYAWADTFTSTLDFPALAASVTTYARQVVRNLRA